LRCVELSDSASITSGFFLGCMLLAGLELLLLPPTVPIAPIATRSILATEGGAVKFRGESTIWSSLVVAREMELLQSLRSDLVDAVEGASEEPIGDFDDVCRGEVRRGNESFGLDDGFCLSLRIVVCESKGDKAAANFGDGALI